MEIDEIAFTKAFNHAFRKGSECSSTNAFKLELCEFLEVYDAAISQQPEMPNVLVHMPGRFINLHISLLPYGRGADPCVWSWLEGTPAGVTIHEIDAGVDTGPIIVQKRLVRKNFGQTLRSEYADLQTELRCLFYEYWPTLLDMPRKPQIGKGTYHNTAQFARLKDELLGPEGWDVQINTLLDRWGKYGLNNYGDKITGKEI